MIRFEEYLSNNETDLVLVVGDVTSTMACAITSQKLHIKVARRSWYSFQGLMPEEINRLVTDSITDYFFTTSRLAGDNLRSEGHNNDKIFFVGNCMIDTLLTNKPEFIKQIFKKLNLTRIS